MKISVIIAALNAEQWLAEQLDALADQTFTGEMEVLVCDNGSTDGTPELVRSRQLTNPSLRLIDASGQRGSGYARNVGVDHATGDIVAFCDADDVVSAQWVQAMAEAASTHDVVAGRLTTDRLNPKWTRVARHVAEGIQQSAFLPFSGGGNLAMRRDIFLAVSGFDPKQVLLEDVDFSWRLQLAGFQLAFEPKALIHVRLRRSLDGIYRQGFEYGEGLAQLETRYGVRPPTDTRRDTGHRIPLKAPAKLVTMLLSKPSRGSLGHVMWQLGWHIGNRTAQQHAHHAAKSPPRVLSE
jgi:glycosyltransferase involved in cell wall biosynthesis